MATEPLLSTPPPSPSFYKRQLPDSCIPYASTRGKELFKKALLEGNLEGYFPLSAQFITQNEPAFCGLGTLCMILNALEVDPKRKWKGPWRWYEQEMLDCCRPLSAVANVGITLSEFACLARCNGLSATVVAPSLTASDVKDREALQRFREDLRRAARGAGALAMSYSRKTLGQTGDGHFSPIGGFCEEEDMVLILDVARFKYPSYWIPVSVAWESMKPLDKATAQPRGYAVLQLLPASDPTSLSAPLSHTSLTLNKSSWAVLSSQLTKVLLSHPGSNHPSTLLSSLSRVISSLPTPPTAARPSSIASIPALLAPLIELSPPLPQDPFSALFLLALLSPKSSLANLVPPAMKAELNILVEGALSKGGVRNEVEVLSTQLAALGECCRAEEEGAACGCAGVAK